MEYGDFLNCLDEIIEDSYGGKNYASKYGVDQEFGKILGNAIDTIAYQINFNAYLLLNSLSKALVRLYNSRQYINRTTNLSSSIGCAVYFNGSIINFKSKRSPIVMMSDVVSIRQEGRSYHIPLSNTIYYAISEYLSQYTPKNKGLTAVVMVGMPYGELENNSKLRVGTMLKNIVKQELSKNNAISMLDVETRVSKFIHL